MTPVVQLSGVSLPGHAGARLGKVDLTVQAGEFVTLCLPAPARRPADPCPPAAWPSPAGPGLSTLLSVVGLLLRPVRGCYLLNGTDTASLDDASLAMLRCREIGSVQRPSPLLPARSVLDNVMLPLLYSGLPARQRRRAALDCLARVGLAARASEPAAALPAGERQQAAIARALVTEPALLLFDDPTAHLTTAGTAHVISLLTSLHAGGRTIIVATSDQLAAAYGSRCASIGQPAGQPPADEPSAEASVTR